MNKQAYSPDLKSSHLIAASAYDCDGATTNCTTQLNSSVKGSVNASGRDVHRQLFSPGFLDSQTKSRGDAFCSEDDIPPFDIEKRAKSKLTVDKSVEDLLFDHDIDMEADFYLRGSNYGARSS